METSNQVPGFGHHPSDSNKHGSYGRNALSILLTAESIQLPQNGTKQHTSKSSGSFTSFSLVLPLHNAEQAKN